MRKDTLLRFGFATLLLGGGMGAMFAVGCGSDDNNNGTPVNTTDSGPDSTTPGDDDTNPDTGTGATDTGAPDAAPAPVPAKLIFVHAAQTAPIRLCIGFGDPSDAGAHIQPTPPLPNVALGLPTGLGGPAPKNASSLAGQDLTVYAIPSSEVANVLPSDAGSTVGETTCKDLLGSVLTDGTPDGGALLYTVDGGAPQPYFKLGTIPKGTLVDGTTWLFAVVGSGTSFSIRPYKLDNTTPVAADALGAQFIQASPNFGVVNGMALPTETGFQVTTVSFPDAGASDAAVADAGDAGVSDAAVSDAGPLPVITTVTTPLEDNALFGGPITPATLAPITGLTYDPTNVFFALATTDAGTPVTQAYPYPLGLIQATSWPNGVPDGGAFGNGQGFVFVLVGDGAHYGYTVVGADAGGDGGITFDPLGAHVLAFPTNPPVQ